VSAIEPESPPPTIRRIDQFIGRSAALTGMFL
jgi:hypothetical protein